MSPRLSLIVSFFSLSCSSPKHSKLRVETVRDDSGAGTDASPALVSLSSKNRGTSQFWRSLHKVKHLFKWVAIYKAKGGRNVGFLDDVWIGTTPLRIQFPHLHKMSSFPLARASEYWKDGDWSIDFRRSLTISERASWEELEKSLPTSLVDDERDEVVWALDRTKVFSTKSLYSFLSNRGVCVKESDNIWKTKVP